MISGNATTFCAASQVLPISWTVNPPASPWFGGFYERLVQAIKTPLKKVLGPYLVRIKELETIITEVERLVNSRP